MVSQAQRDAVRRAHRFQCGYCGVHENEAGSELEIDHYQPLANSGPDDEANLVYACPTCNKTKGDFWAQADASQRILHPRRDHLTEHLWELMDARLEPLTLTGEFHIRRLRLNRPQLITLRQARRRASQDTTRIAELESSLDEMRRDVLSLETRLDELLDRINRLTGQSE